MRIQRDVHLAGRAADLEVPDAAQEDLGQFLLLDELEEGALHVGIGDDELAADLLAAGEHDALGLAVA